MMFRREGMTLMEIIVVLIIVGIAVTLSFPNYTTPTEQARAANAQNNLLAIYSAQQNFRNNDNNGAYATMADLASINTMLTLNIQDDGTYRYDCSGGTFTCKATRTSIGSSNTIVLTLNSPINLSRSGTANPQCNLTSNWCP